MADLLRSDFKEYRTLLLSSLASHPGAKGEDLQVLLETLLLIEWGIEFPLFEENEILRVLLESRVALQEAIEKVSQRNRA
jgi:hypothetical protein